MKSFVVKKPAGYEQREIVDMNIPKLKEVELLIKVYSTTVNRTDIITRDGKVESYKSPLFSII